MSKTETQSEALSAERRLFITAVANLELRKKFGDEGFRLDLERDELDALIEMTERVSRLDARVNSLEFSFNEWHDKTDWVQNTIKPRELGMHRADVLRARIEALDAENKALRIATEKAILAMKLAQSTHGVMLMSDPPHDSWRFHRTSDYLRDAIETAQAAAKTGDAAPEIGCKRTGSDENGGAA